MGKVLSVDDSRLMRTIIRGAAESLGFEVLEADNGKKALAVLEETGGEDVELILLDVNMPEMDGFTCLEAIKDNARFQEIPVMMVTTESERSSIVRAIKAGAVNYVCKPFSHEDLIAKMAESLGQGLGI